MNSGWTLLEPLDFIFSVTFKHLAYAKELIVQDEAKVREARV